MIIQFDLKGKHTGDVLLALPVMEGIKSLGHVPVVSVSNKYYAPLSILGIERSTTKPDVSVKPYKKKDRHTTDNWLAAFARIGINVTPRPSFPTIQPNSLLLGNGWCLIQPWCEYSRKEWNVKNWIEVIKGLEQENIKVAIAGPLDYKARANYICNNTSAVNLIGKDNKDTWSTTIAAADVVISPDSGAAHMADALGKPAVVLFGPTNEKVWAPYWNRQFVIKEASMKQIKPKQVIEAAIAAMRSIND